MIRVFTDKMVRKIDRFIMKFERVNVCEDYEKVQGWPCMKWSLVQILVTVAITQMKNLRIEVEKGFRWTMFGPELVDPNVEINFDNYSGWV
jgi:hypothetical protein